MSNHRFFTGIRAGFLLPTAVTFVLLLGACSNDNPVADNPGNGGNVNPPPQNETIPDTAVVDIRLVSWDDLSSHGVTAETPAEVDEARFEISAPDIQTQTRTVSGGQTFIEASFRIATGVARKIKIEALNAADSLIYSGTKFADFSDSLVITGVGMVSSGDGTPPVYAGADDAVAVSNNQILLTWSIAADGSDPDFKALYLIYQSEISGSFDYSSPSYVTEPGETSYLISGLSPSTPYYFVVRAMDRTGNTTTNTAQLSLTTSASGGALYVDVDTGYDNPPCGTSGSPYKTITYALSKSTAGQDIHVAKGSYTRATGELFPLQLKDGQTLQGEGYWWNGVKVIAETIIDGPTPVLVGADGASVIACYFRPTAWGSNNRVIDDGGYSMTVFRCTLDGTLEPRTQAIAFSSGSSLIESRIENFNGPGGRAVGVWGAGDVLIKGNLIKNNSNGIGISASHVVVSHNWIENIEGSGIGVSTWDTLVTDVLIFHNHIESTSYTGIDLTRCTDTEIISNSISNTALYSISIWNDQQPAYVKVLANWVTHGGSLALYLIGGGADVWDNTFVCNNAGVFVRTDQVIDLRWNSWDNDTPIINDGAGAYTPGCDGTYDICYEALYALTPEPLYLPSHLKGTCVVGIMPSSPWAPGR